jgi:hypothetical protein
MQVRIYITTNSQALICCVNVSFVIVHERTTNRVFQYSLSILRLLTVFRCGCRKCCLICKGDGSQLTVLLVPRGEDVKHWLQRTILYHGEVERITGEEKGKLIVKILYRVSQEERAIFWEVMLSVILSKNIVTCFSD